MYSYRNELYHHGIKGQKWGVRRFQNEDGSLTSKGKSRYGKGKEIFKEQSKISWDKQNELMKSSKKYQKASKEYDRLSGKSDEELNDYEKAKKTVLAYDIDRMGDEFYDKAEKYANEKIIEKYGKVGLSDMKHYQRVNTIAVGAAMLATFGAMVVLSNKGSSSSGSSISPEDARLLRQAMNTRY